MPSQTLQCALAKHAEGCSHLEAASAPARQDKEPPPPEAELISAPEPEPVPKVAQEGNLQMVEEALQTLKVPWNGVFFYVFFPSGTRALLQGTSASLL